MVRFRLISAADDPTELWQAEFFHHRLDKVPAGIAWVQVKPSIGVTFRATMLGTMVGEGQRKENNIAAKLIEESRLRWPGFHRIREPSFRP